eukprot:gene33354-41158_t
MSFVEFLSVIQSVRIQRYQRTHSPLVRAGFESRSEDVKHASNIYKMQLVVVLSVFNMVCLIALFGALFLNVTLGRTVAPIAPMVVTVPVTVVLNVVFITLKLLPYECSHSVYIPCYIAACASFLCLLDIYEERFVANACGDDEMGLVWRYPAYRLAT